MVSEGWTYKCFDCGRLCTDMSKTEEEATEEMRKVFGDIPKDLTVTYCEDCADKHPELGEMTPVAEA